MKTAKILRWYDAEGNYIGPKDKQVKVNGETFDLQQYADMNGIELPKPNAKKKQQKEVNSYADMGQPLDEGHTEIDGDGDSQSKE